MTDNTFVFYTFITIVLLCMFYGGEPDIEDYVLNKWFDVPLPIENGE